MREIRNAMVEFFKALTSIDILRFPCKSGEQLM